MVTYSADNANSVQPTPRDSQSNDYMLQRRDSFISYDTFLSAYWPHLPQPLTKGLGNLFFCTILHSAENYPVDPALVFAEFMGKDRLLASANKT